MGNSRLEIGIRTVFRPVPYRTAALSVRLYGTRTGSCFGNVKSPTAAHAAAGPAIKSPTTSSQLRTDRHSLCLLVDTSRRICGHSGGIKATQRLAGEWPHLGCPIEYTFEPA